MHHLWPCETCSANRNLMALMYKAPNKAPWRSFFIPFSLLTNPEHFPGSYGYKAGNNKSINQSEISSENNSRNLKAISDGPLVTKLPGRSFYLNYFSHV